MITLFGFLLIITIFFIVYSSEFKITEGFGGGGHGGGGHGGGIGHIGRYGGFGRGWRYGDYYGSGSNSFWWPYYSNPYPYYTYVSTYYPKKQNTTSTNLYIITILILSIALVCVAIFK